MYADYEFYLNQYYGNQISESDFPRLSSLASDFIRAYTKGISDTVKGTSLEAVQRCTCAVADIFHDEDNMRKSAFNANGVVASESVGPWSKSYNSGLSSYAIDYLKTRKNDALWLYLSMLPEFAELFAVISYKCKHDARHGRRHT